MRRLAAAIVLVCSLRVIASAAITMSPNPVVTPATNIGMPSMIVTGTLAGNAGDKVDLVIGACNGGNGTFDLQPNQSVSIANPKPINVYYIPSAAGTRTCTVNVYDEATTNLRYTFSVTGTGIAPAMIAVSTPSAFPAVRVLDTAVAPHTSTRTVTVQNDGGSALMITNVTFTTGEFSIDPSSQNGTTATINGGGNAKSWILRFDPMSPGTRNATVTFASNAGNASVNLVGDGTTGLFTATPTNAGDFGTVAAGSTAGLDIAITHTGAIPKGILTFSPVTITPGAGYAGWFSVAAQPSTLSSGTTTGTVTVTCSPPVGSTATGTATVNISADADATPMRTVNIQCTGGSSLLALATSSVDMDPTLVGTTSPSKSIVLMNTGNTGANVGFASGSANAGRFSVSGPGGCGVGVNNCAVGPSSSIMLTMTFSPTQEATVSASFNVQGAGAAPSFIVTGRGIDRHISVADSIAVEDTYRNPGSMAPVTPVTIVNVGEYPIMLGTVQIGPDTNLWSLVDPIPTTVPGLGSADILVRFSPSEAGKADDGLLVIPNDDNKVAGGMPVVILSGNGKDRNLDVTPGAIDLGDRAVGTPTRLSLALDGLRLSFVNNDTDAFTVREITVEGTTSLVVEPDDGVVGSVLQPAETRPVDLVLTPTAAGDITATLAIYLDEDTTPQRIVVVHMNAVTVDIHGGGGCSTGGGAGPFALLALVGLRRRRRR